jgi:hypothetical protein
MSDTDRDRPRVHYDSFEPSADSSKSAGLAWKLAVACRVRSSRKLSERSTDLTLQSFKPLTNEQATERSLRW